MSSSSVSPGGESGQGGMTGATAFQRLFSPVSIGRLVLRNRIVLTGHGTGMGQDHRPDEQMIAYYERRAEGEVGLIMLGSQQVHPSSPGITGLLCNVDDDIIPGLRAVGDAVHRHGGRVFGQLSHMGMAASARPAALWSASSVQEQKYGEVAHAMSVAEIEAVTAAFAAAAGRCIEAGLDGVQVQCGHGLLLHQFLSPLTNHRRDGYGGALHNRVRFAAEVLRATRRTIGDAVPLGIRCSGDELLDGGLTATDMAEIVPMLVAAGRLDYVDVSAGNDGDLVSNMRHEPPMGRPAAPFAAVARQIRAGLTVPVVHGTRIDTVERAEALLARGDADLVGMCRALIADPFLPAKARRGRGADIIPCVACEQACFGRLHRGLHISCVGNPATGRERAFAAVTATAAPRQVMVIGGGPAGIAAATEAARRGHKVTLIEASAALGGRMVLAGAPAGREEWRRLLTHGIAALAASGAALRLGLRADAALVRTLALDAVLIATGAAFERLALPGAATAPLISVDDAVADPARLGDAVLVIDRLDRQPGLVAAIMLAEHGRSVTIATPSLHVGLKLELQNLTEFYRRAYAAGVRMLSLASAVSFDGGRVVLRNPISGHSWIAGPFDSIVVASPGRACGGLADELAGSGLDIRTIGDAYAPRDIDAAILEGVTAGHAV